MGHVLYVVVCGAGNAASSSGFVKEMINSGWDVCVIASPAALAFIDAEDLAEISGHPVRSKFKDPDAPDLLPPPDVIVVAPATFNTVNKLANGISDTLATAILCEALGKKAPMIMAPWMNCALANHSAYTRSIRTLQGDGVRFVLTEQTMPGAVRDNPDEGFPWATVSEAVRKLQHLDSASEDLSNALDAPQTDVDANDGPRPTA
ncbi:flavoprotein [Krasilnikovia sp. M28-CT-15]|uniref:flavoprotein n=1 Tax=Krasilnikovia sp. M28-CT-15 TaxID=3373540 RepID=UPI0038770834